MSRKMTLDDVDSMWNQWLFLYPENIWPASREIAEKKLEELLERWNLPVVLVRRNGELLFNSTAKEFEIVEEVTDAVELCIAMDYFKSLPVCILLTDRLKTLLEAIPELSNSEKLDVVDFGVSLSLDKNHPSRRK